LISDHYIVSERKAEAETRLPALKDVIEDLYNSKRKVIFTMGKGGVGKTPSRQRLPLGLSVRKAKKFI
jgi:arsenite-transporting ATPase